MRESYSRTRAYIIVVFFALGAMLNCAGEGCEGCDLMETIPGGFPSERRIENGMQIRVTSQGIQFLEENLDRILGDMMPDGLVFEVPPQCDIEILWVGMLDLCGTGSSDNCVADEPPCMLEVEILELSISPAPPASLNIDARINFWSLETMHTHSFLPGLNCQIDVDTRLGSQAYANATARIDFLQDSQSNRTSAVLTDLDIPDGDIESEDLVISGGLTCSGIDTFFKNTIIRQVKDKVREKIDEMMLSTNVTCDPDEPECPEMSSCQEVILQDNEGNDLFFYYCREDSDEGWVQAMGMEGRLNLGGLLYSLAPGSNDLDLHLRAGGYSSVVNEGLSLGVLAGTESSPANHPCVPALDPPLIEAAPTSTVFEGETRPDEKPFQIGIGIHKSFLETAIYAMFDAGAFCMAIGPRQNDFLTMGSFSVFLDSMTDLIHDGDPGIVLHLRPQSPFSLDLGAGTTDEEGNIEEPLLTLGAQDLAVDLYAFIDYRFIRLFRIIGDVSLPLNLDINEENQLIPVLGDLKGAFENIRVEESRLLAEDPEEIASVFPILIDTVSGMLGGNVLGPIDLPAFAGFNLILEEGSIASVDNNTFLAIFAGLDYVGIPPEEPSQLIGSVQTFARLVGVELPSEKDFNAISVDHTLKNGPVAVISLDAEVEPSVMGPEDIVEFSYRLNKGLWSPYFQTRTLEIQRPGLWLRGVHKVEVKARIAGKPESADPTPAVVEIEIDSHTGLAMHEDSSHSSAGLYGRVSPPSSGCSCRSSSEKTPGFPLLFLLVPALCFAHFMKRRSRGSGAKSSLVWLILPAIAITTVFAGCKKSAGRDCGDPSGLPLICAEPIPQCEYYEYLVGLEEMTYDRSCNPVPVLCDCDSDEVETGNYGRFLSMAEHNGLILISCYSDQWGDLNVVEVDHEGKIIPEAVDGVPFGTPLSGDPDGFRAGLARRGENVGKYTSIAFDSQGYAHISYIDVDERSVKHTKGLPGDWLSNHLENEKEGHEESVYTALLIDENDIPHIFFMVTGLEDEEGLGFKSELRLASASSSSPGNPADWSIEVIDETPVPCGGLCPEDKICLAESWTCVTEDDDCDLCEPNEGCIMGECIPVLEKPTWTDLPEGTGLFVSTGLLSDGRMVAVYYDRSAGSAMFASGMPGQSWNVQVLEGDAYSDVGLYASLFVDDEDNIHIAYHDAVHDNLVYRRLDSELTPEVREIADNGDREGEYHVVGLDTRIFSDRDNAVRIFYQDGTAADLWEAVRIADDEWSASPHLESEAGHGFFTHVVRASDGTFWAAEYRYDREAEKFKGVYAWSF